MALADAGAGAANGVAASETSALTRFRKMCIAPGNRSWRSRKGSLRRIVHEERTRDDSFQGNSILRSCWIHCTQARYVAATLVTGRGGWFWRPRSYLQHTSHREETKDGRKDDVSLYNKENLSTSICLLCRR